MANASINMTIDLAGFRNSLTAAFAMYETTLKAMGKDNPKALSGLTSELDKIAEKASKPMLLKADGTAFKAEVTDAAGKIDELESKSKQSGESLRSWWDQHKTGLSSFSLIYRGVMDIYNDVTRVFGGMINQQIEAQKGLARVEAAMRSSGVAAGYTAEQLKGLAGGLEEAFAFDADDIMNQVTTPLLTFRAVSGEVFEDAQVQILNMSRALGMDLQGAAMQVGKALQDPVEGLTALRRSGVSFNDEQQKMIQGMYEAGDAAGAQKLILAELNAEFGGQAAAYMETGAGKLDALKVAFDNLSESIGGLLLPVITGLGAVVKPLVEWFSNIDNAFKVMIPTLVLATAAWYKYSVAQTATATISGALTGAVAAAAAAVQGFLVAVGPVGWVLMGITAAVTAWTVVKGQAKDKTDELAGAQKGLKEEIKSAQNEVSVEAEKFSMLASRLLELKGQTDQTAASKTEMKSVIRSLNENYGEYLGNINLEAASYDRLAEALQGASNALIQKKIAEVYGQRYQAQLQKAADLQVQLNDLQKQAADNYWKYAQDRENLQGGPGDYQKLSPEGIMNQQITEVRNNLNLAKGELSEFADAYRQAMLNAPVITGAGGGGGGGQGNTGTSAADAAAREAETRAREARRMILELEQMRKSETEQLELEYRKREAIILQYTEDGSEAERNALADLDLWKQKKEDEITTRQKIATEERFRSEVSYLANLQEMGVSSYDQLKAKMEEYYAWAKDNLSAEEAVLVQKQMQESNLRWGAHQKEKEDKERAHQRTLADIRAEWDARNLSLEEADREAQLEALRRKFEDEKALMIEAGMSEVEIAKWLAEKRERIYKESEEKIQSQKASVVSSGLSQLSGVFGKFGDAQNKESERGFKTWKALATAQAFVDMGSAVLGAFKSQISIPIVGPILAAAQAAAAMAFGASQIANIRKTEYSPPQAADGGYLDGPGHERGGVIIEAEGGEYITKKSRVSELGKGIFDFINNGPIATVRQLFAGMAMPAIEFNAAMAGADGGGSYFASGGSVPGSNAVTSLLGSLDDKLGRLLEKRVAFDIYIDPLDNNPVRISEIAEMGRMIRSEV